MGPRSKIERSTILVHSSRRFRVTVLVIYSYPYTRPSSCSGPFCDVTLTLKPGPTTTRSIRDSQFPFRATRKSAPEFNTDLYQSFNGGDTLNGGEKKKIERAYRSKNFFIFLSFSLLSFQNNF